MCGQNGNVTTSEIRRLIADALRLRRSEDYSWIEAIVSNDGWSMSLDALSYLASVLKLMNPRHVLEFGAGISTYVIDQSARRENFECRVSSIDHDPVYGGVAATERYFGKGGENIGPNIKMQIAPIVAREFGGRFLPAYLLDRGKLSSTEPPDLVIIDAPPNALGGREGVLYQALEMSRPGTLILLDDAARQEEKFAISQWNQMLGDAIEIVELPEFARGLAAVIVRETIRISDLEEHRLKLVRAEVKSVLPNGSQLVLVGDDWLCTEIQSVYKSRPFLERDGEYMGPPADDDTAIRELARMSREGSGYLLITSSAFWWLDYYRQWAEHLRVNCPCLLANERFVLYDLRKT